MITELFENRFANESEFIQNLSEQNIEMECQASGTPLYYSNGKVYTDNSDAHTLIFGNTGSKKTRNFCIPTVYMLGMAGESMIISDPKGEIYRASSGFLKEKEYSVKVLNLRTPDYSSRWNPLLLPYRYYKDGNKDKAIEMVSDFCMQLKAQVHSEKDQYWENQAMDLLIGIILLLFECESDEKKIHMESVQRIRMHIYIESDSGVISEKMSDAKKNVFWDAIQLFPSDSIIRYKLSSVYSLRHVEKTLSCIVSVFDSMIRNFIFNKKLMNLLNASEICFKDFLGQKTVLYLIIPDEKTTFHFLVSVFVKQCYEYMIDKAQQCKSGKLSIRLNFILDEFSNFPRISDMPAMISAARSRNIRFLLVVQSKQQLLTQYGNDAETIKSNCKNWIYLSCRELDLLKEIEELCGVTEIDGKIYPLMSITQLQRLQVGMEDSQALILCSRVAPYISWVKDFSLYPQAKYEEYFFPKTILQNAECFSLVKYVYDILVTKEEVKEEIDLDKYFDS